ALCLVGLGQSGLLLAQFFRLLVGQFFVLLGGEFLAANCDFRFERRRLGLQFLQTVIGIGILRLHRLGVLLAGSLHGVGLIDVALQAAGGAEGVELAALHLQKVIQLL